MSEKITFVDIDLAEDVKGFVLLNKDVTCKEQLKDKINKFCNDDLLKVTKEIGSHTTILDVELVTEELLTKEL